MKKRIAIGILSSALVLGLAGCNDYNDERGKGDAPVAERDNSAAKVINFPNSFMNVAFKCNGRTGIYAHTREAAPQIVPNDPECTGQG